MVIPNNQAAPIPSATTPAPNSVYEAPQEQNKNINYTRLLKYLQDEFKRMDDDRKSRAQSWTKMHAQFRGIMDKKSSVNKSQLFINRTKVAVMAGLANVMDVIFPSSDFFDVLGRTEFDEKGAGLAKNVMDWLIKIGNFTEEGMRYILQAAIYGTTFGKICKHTATHTVLDKTPIIGPMGQPVGYQSREIKRQVSFYALETLDIYDVWIDSDAVGTIDTASGFFTRSLRSLAYVKEKEAAKIFGNIIDIGIATSRNTDIDDKRRSNLGLPELPTKQDAVYIYEYQGKIPSDICKESGIDVAKDEFETECIVHLANMRTIIRTARNTAPGQERTLISDVWELPGDKSVYGRGIPENTKGAQVALNMTVNTRLDNKSWAIAAPIVVNSTKLEDPKDLIARPNWTIRGKDSPDNVAKFVQIPDMTSTAMIEGKDFERIIDDASGQTQIAQSGTGFGQNRTAQGVTLAFSAASRPVRLIARGFEQNLVAKGLKKIFMFFVADLDEWILLRVTDNPNASKFLKVDPVSLALDLDFTPSGSYMLAMRENATERMSTFIRGVSKIKSVVDNVNWKYVTQKFYEGLGLHDFEKVWLDRPAIAPGIPGLPKTPQVPRKSVGPSRMSLGGNRNVQAPVRPGATPTQNPGDAIERILGSLAKRNPNTGGGGK